MKRRKTWIRIILTTFLFLLLLLAVQIVWLVETAETEKRHFTQSVKLSLDLTITQILSDQRMCSNIQMCLLDTQCIKTKALKKLEWEKTDSIIKSNLKFYDIDCKYNFELSFLNPDSSNNEKQVKKQFSTDASVLSFRRGNIQIDMSLPQKSSFITKKIGPLFIMSIILILMVAGSFIFTMKIYRKAENNIQLLKNFTLNMAHEFKTPLSVIGLANSRIKNQIDNPEKGKLIKYLEIIDNEKNKIENHLSAILNLAYFENKSTTISMDWFEIKLIVDSAFSNIATLLDELNGTLETDFNLSPEYIYCNRELLISCLTNVLDNACKYSNTGLKLRIGCYNKGDHTVFDICDNGIGISSKDLPYVFEKYFRVDTGNIHNIKGYGIGLSFVKEVIQKHGGKVELHSKIGEGSRFLLFLPIIDKKNEN